MKAFNAITVIFLVSSIATASTVKDVLLGNTVYNHDTS